ncbi:MAG: aminotransferase class III-fold pyridoxal phosphate-dependent enzyme [Calditrichota bacterium]|jgi:acetylornithine/N-succinyldiaminopimelate aminotransferase
MKLFDVYPLLDFEPVQGKGCYLFDGDGNQYLDLYGGHAVISVGHSHPHYLQSLYEQAGQLGFYSNSVKNSLQVQLAEKLGALSGYPDYQLFLCNSGTEANENALKLASFYNHRQHLVAFEKAFHGRTAGSLAVTDNGNIKAALNESNHVTFLPLNKFEKVAKLIEKQEICAVIIEGIQGVGGIYLPKIQFLQKLAELCGQNNIILILDEVQSGYGRSGQFFAHQLAGIHPDLITVAKGMGNGFPIGGVLIHPKFRAKHGMLGTTFGGNQLACRAAMAVLDIIEQENLVENARMIGNYLMEELVKFNGMIKEVRGLGLMIGIEFPFPYDKVRNSLFKNYKIITGSSSQKNTMRILPPLNIKKVDIDYFLESFKQVLNKV